MSARCQHQRHRKRGQHAGSDRHCAISRGALSAACTLKVSTNSCEPSPQRPLFVTEPCAHDSRPLALCAKHGFDRLRFFVRKGSSTLSGLGHSPAPCVSISTQPDSPAARHSVEHHATEVVGEALVVGMYNATLRAAARHCPSAVGDRDPPRSASIRLTSTSPEVPIADSRVRDLIGRDVSVHTWQEPRIPAGRRCTQHSAWIYTAHGSIPRHLNG